jgi:hypothetical protein
MQAELFVGLARELAHRPQCIGPKTAFDALNSRVAEAAEVRLAGFQRTMEK